MRHTLTAVLLAALLASCGQTPRPTVAAPSAARADYTLTVPTSGLSDEALAARYGGPVLLRAGNRAVIGLSEVSARSVRGRGDLAALSVSPQPNRGVMHATSGVAADGTIGMFADGTIGMFADGTIGMFADGTIGMFADGTIGMFADGTIGMFADAIWQNGQFGLMSGNTDEWKLVHLDAAHQNSASLGLGSTIAVIDTGLDTTHSFFARNLAPSAAWKDFVDGDADPQEVGTLGQGAYGHGTGVAGIALQVAPLAKVLPVRALQPDGSGDASDVAQAIVWAADHGATVINLSLGSTEPLDAVNAAVAYANGLGVAVVGSAGNAGVATLNRPARDFFGSNLDVSVGSVGLNGTRSSFSNYGADLELFAPGEAIRAPLPGNRAADWSGTSMSTPVAAGALALGLADAAATSAPGGAQAVVTALTSNTLPVTGATGGPGLLNVDSVARH